jgi:hypothetical protein
VNKRLQWFDEGTPHLRAILSRLGHEDALPDSRDYYACPCCLGLFTREAAKSGLLTEEHVPPKKLGGQPLVLSCRNCNSEAGRLFDAHAVTRARSDDFARGRVTGAVLPVTAYADGHRLAGTVQWTEGGIQILPVDRQNDPRVQAAHLQALNEFAEHRDPRPNFSFTVHARFDEARARYSWIRSAYLAGFAGLGWSYILRPVMQPVREQLANPDAGVISTYMFRDPEAVATTRRLLIVNEPEELRCVAVLMGEHGVFLPAMFNSTTMHELSEAFARRCGDDGRLNVTYSGKEVPWPSRATYFLDR